MSHIQRGKIRSFFLHQLQPQHGVTDIIIRFHILNILQGTLPAIVHSLYPINAACRRRYGRIGLHRILTGLPEPLICQFPAGDTILAAHKHPGFQRFSQGTAAAPAKPCAIEKVIVNFPCRRLPWLCLRLTGPDFLQAVRFFKREILSWLQFHKLVI